MLVEGEEEIQKKLEPNVAEPGVGKIQLAEQRQLQHGGHNAVGIALQGNAREIDAAQLAASLVDIVNDVAEQQQPFVAEVAALQV
jgi:hypothetical protein